MNSWSSRRKAIIFTLVLLVLAVLIGLPIFFYLHKAPSCFDGKQDGDETGVDCGGSCALVCTSDTLPIISNGDARVLEVASSTYEVVVSVQNPNVSAEVVRAPFTFTLYGATDEAPIKVIQGSTFVPRDSSFGIFEGPFDFATDTPVRATFAWGSNLAWQKNTDPQPDLEVTGNVLSDASTSPRLEATLTNDSLGEVSNIELVAFISDENDTIIGASRTFVDSLEPGASAPLVFTWPQAFQGNPVTIQILPQVLPDASYLY